MKDNLHRRLSLSEMARSVHLSPSRLRYVFRAETGTSVGRHLRDLRMAEAKQLLGSTFLSVKEVAARVGIVGISHFVRDFKTRYGSTPARYRELSRTDHHKPTKTTPSEQIR